MSKLRSKCCGAKYEQGIYRRYSSFQDAFITEYKWRCSQCKKFVSHRQPTEVEEKKEEEGE